MRQETDSMSFGGGTYNDPISPEARLFQLGVTFPNVVSLAVLGHSLHGKRILDIGCGSNPDLGAKIEQRGGYYFGVDKDQRCVDALRASKLQASRGDLMQMHPYSSSRPHIVHVRKVLEYLTFEERRRAIYATGTAAIEEAVYLAVDWTTFECGPLVGAFKNFLMVHLGHKVNFTLGQSLHKEVRAALLRTEHDERIVRSVPIVRPMGHMYWSEILLFADQAMVDVAAAVRHGDISPDDATEFGHIVNSLYKEADKPKPEEFRPADLVCVRVRK